MEKQGFSVLFTFILVKSLVCDVTSICPFTGKNDKTFEVCCQIGETIEFRAPTKILAVKLDNAKNWLCSCKDNLLWVQPRFTGLREKLFIFARHKGRIILFTFILTDSDKQGIPFADIIEIKVGI